MQEGKEGGDLSKQVGSSFFPSRNRHQFRQVSKSLPWDIEHRSFKKKIIR